MISSYWHLLNINIDNVYTVVQQYYKLVIVISAILMPICQIVGQGSFDQTERTYTEPPPPPPPPPLNDVEEFIYTSSIFKKCQSLIGLKEKENCAKTLMSELIYQNLEYPEAAREQCIEGMTIVQFCVSHMGGIEDIKVVRDIGGGCGQAAVRAIEKSIDDGLHFGSNSPIFRPTARKSRLAEILYTIPIRFELPE